MTSQKIIIDDAEELALEIQRELEQDREDQFILEQIEQLDKELRKNTNLEVGNKEGQEQQQQEPWYEYYNKSDNEKLLNETIITLRLTKKHYRTAYTLAHMLGHKSLDDYISFIVVQNLEMEIKGGDIDIDMDKLF